jgi:hypothetical protein
MITFFEMGNTLHQVMHTAIDCKVWVQVVIKRGFIAQGLHKVHTNTNHRNMSKTTKLVINQSPRKPPTILAVEIPRDCQETDASRNLQIKLIMREQEGPFLDPMHSYIWITCIIFYTNKTIIYGTVIVFETFGQLLGIQLNVVQSCALHWAMVGAVESGELHLPVMLERRRPRCLQPSSGPPLVHHEGGTLKQWTIFFW